MSIRGPNNLHGVELFAPCIPIIAVVCLLRHAGPDLLETMQICMHVIAASLVIAACVQHAYSRVLHVRRILRSRPAVRTVAVPIEETKEEPTVKKSTRKRHPKPVQIIEPRKESTADELITCIICMDRRRDALLPCRHLCTCTECTEQISACPLCRDEFSTFTSVFMT